MLSSGACSRVSRVLILWPPDAYSLDSDDEVDGATTVSGEVCDWTGETSSTLTTGVEFENVPDTGVAANGGGGAVADELPPDKANCKSCSRPSKARSATSRPGKSRPETIECWSNLCCICSTRLHARLSVYAYFTNMHTSRARAHLREAIVLRPFFAYLHISGRSTNEHCWQGCPPPHRVFFRRHSRQAVDVDIRFSAPAEGDGAARNVWYMDMI